MKRYLADQVWLCQVGKNVHEEGGYGTSVKSGIGKRSCNGLHATSGSEICFQNTSGMQLHKLQ